MSNSTDNKTTFRAVTRVGESRAGPELELDARLWAGDPGRMALLRCLDCGRELSSMAPACPWCGRPSAIARPPGPQGFGLGLQHGPLLPRHPSPQTRGIGSILVVAAAAVLGGGLIAGACAKSLERNDQRTARLLEQRQRESEAANRPIRNVTVEEIVGLVSGLSDEEARRSVESNYGPFRLRVSGRVGHTGYSYEGHRRHVAMIGLRNKNVAINARTEATLSEGTEVTLVCSGGIYYSADWGTDLVGCVPER